MSERSEPVYGILSDDFTGGLLVASYFEEAGIECPVYFDPAVAAADDSGAPIVVVAGRMRLSPPADALAEMTRGLDSLDALGCGTVAYKACASFDSTEEGNIGIAADLLADRYSQVPMLISAGFPEFRATVHQGYLFYQATLVNESVKRFDPVTPMPDPNLVRFLSHQTRSPLGLVSHLDLVQGEAAARAALAGVIAAGHRHVLLDSSDAHDIEISTQLALDSRAFVASDPLVVGFGLARAAAFRGTATPPKQVDGPAAVLVGSVGPVAEGQLAAFCASHEILTLDLLDERTEDAQIKAALDWARCRIGAAPFAITTCADAAGVGRAQEKMGRIGAARRAERLLAGIARGLHAGGVRRLIVVGGETSGSVIGALGIARVRALGRGPLGGGFCIAEGEDPMSLFLKSGKLGTPDVLLRALEAMRP